MAKGDRHPFAYHRPIVGFHGCDRSTVEKIPLQGESLEPSKNDYDWLGEGAYFWEHGLQRALEFAEEQKERGRIETPAVLGAYIHLGQCWTGCRLSGGSSWKAIPCTREPGSTPRPMSRSQCEIPDASWVTSCRTPAILLDGGSPMEPQLKEQFEKARERFVALTLDQRLARLQELGILDANGDLAEQYRAAASPGPARKAAKKGSRGGKSR